ncbi:hypothetical protein LUZ60_006916 [Juncus effusus]|nr:hypothetical protein LUZ60_006916 [Juncus effusus]
MQVQVFMISARDLKNVNWRNGSLKPYAVVSIDSSVKFSTKVDLDNNARILALNASYFLKNGGHFVISIKANCIDSTVPAEAVFASEVKKLQAEQFKPAEQVTLEPFERDHACVVGGYACPRRTSLLLSFS